MAVRLVRRPHMGVQEHHASYEGRTSRCGARVIGGLQAESAEPDAQHPFQHDDRDRDAEATTDGRTVMGLAPPGPSTCGPPGSTCQDHLISTI